MMRNKIIGLCAAICISSLHGMQEQDFQRIQIKRKLSDCSLLQGRPVRSADRIMRPGGLRYVIHFADQSVAHFAHILHKGEYHYYEQRLNGDSVQHSGPDAERLFKHYRSYILN
ncbi:MAG TPA: hypothetical protein VGT41_06670 [Candidatus Babeliales bacterium]|nr:hypothetical protein [Candidatus Babeliales bacterium]